MAKMIRCDVCQGKGTVSILMTSAKLTTGFRNQHEIDEAIKRTVILENSQCPKCDGKGMTNG